MAIYCPLLLGLAVTWLAMQMLPGVFSALGRSIGGTARLIKRHPWVSVITLWLMMAAAAQAFHDHL